MVIIATSAPNSTRPEKVVQLVILH